MAAMTDTLENKLLDWFFRGQAIGLNGATAAAGTGPANLYVGLLTTSPSDGSTGTEVTGGSYARVTVASNTTNWSGTQGAATTGVSSGTGGTISNNTAITFPAPSANWGTVYYFGIWDSLTNGSMLFYGSLTTPKTINNGDAAPSFAAAALTVQIDN